MNIIFLDVDGVLNSKNKLIEVYNKTGRPHSGYSYPFDEKCMKNLRNLVLETNSNIVITSTWRKSEQGKKVLLDEFKKYELDEYVFGYTPVLNTKRREEIKNFLIDLDEDCSLVILDDDSDMEELLPFLVKTDSGVGLTAKNIKEAIEILNSQN